MGRGWVAAGWVAAGGGDPPATHLDGNGNGNGNNGNGNGNGNEPVGARHAPSQRAQGSHMPFGAPPSANPLTLISLTDEPKPIDLRKKCPGVLLFNLNCRELG